MGTIPPQRLISPNTKDVAIEEARRWGDINVEAPLFIRLQPRRSSPMKLTQCWGIGIIELFEVWIAVHPLLVLLLE